MDVLVGQLANISSGNQMKKPPVKTTQPKEFSLTKPKPAAIPVPELIPLQEKCKPVGLSVKNRYQGYLNNHFKGVVVLQVPVCTYKPPKEMQKIEEIKKKNQQRTQVFFVM